MSNNLQTLANIQRTHTWFLCSCSLWLNQAVNQLVNCQCTTAALKLITRLHSTGTVNFNIMYTRSEAYDGTASPHRYHTEKKTHVVWPLGQNGRDSWRQEDSDWCPSEWLEQASWAPLHNLTFEDAIELAMDKPLWRLLVASGATHWHGACRIMMMTQQIRLQKKKPKFQVWAFID